MTVWRTVRFASVALVMFTGCRDAVVPPVTEPPDTVSSDASKNVFERAISEPVQAATGSLVSASSLDGNVYVAFSTGELPDVRSVRIRNLRAGVDGSIPYAVTNGALDPVAVPASIGDTLELLFTKLDGTYAHLRAVVPARRPPRVIRTDPPKGRTDVGLNSKILVVFSEPIDPSTVTSSSLRLLAGIQPVPGTLILGESPTLAVVFAPDAPLSPGSAYTLEVARGIRDLNGDSLQLAETVGFTAGEAAGRIQGTTSTTGADPDPDGYSLQLVERYGRTTSVPIAGNGTVTTPELAASTYTITLKGVAENCVVDGGATRQLELQRDAVPTITFDVRCESTRQLVFVRDGQIYLVNSNATGLVRLTNTEANVSNADPAWSPDGRRIAFVSGSESDTDIYVMAADGSNVVRRTIQGAWNRAPAWSPDGKKIAFFSLRDGYWRIYVMEVDGDWANPTHMSDAGAQANPDWSPDGGTITFVGMYDEVYNLWAMDADGSDVRPVIEGPDLWSDGLTFYFQPAWSPDGQKIALVMCGYAYDKCYPDSTLEIINPDGTGRTLVTAAGGFANPTWSPDGGTLAFSSATCRACPSSIRYVRVDRSSEDVIITNGHSPAWRP